jgi:hypothetical protein
MPHLRLSSSLLLPSFFLTVRWSVGDPRRHELLTLTPPRDPNREPLHPVFVEVRHRDGGVGDLEREAVPPTDLQGELVPVDGHDLAHNRVGRC